MEIQRPSPHLPTELWVRVLECLNDDDELPLLWACCRHVSTAWREAVEFMFRQIHLRETWITIDLRTHSDKNIRLEDRSVSVIFTYSHLSHDKKTAYFSFINESSYIEDYEGRSRRAVRYAAAFKNIEEPAHHVQVRGDLNDTPVPKLKIDCDAMLLSFDWRGVYSAFYGEEKLYRDINNQLFEELKDSLGDLQTKMDGGQLALDCATATLRTIQERIEKESRHAKILARRSRIRRQFKELNGTEWDAERDWDLKAEEIVMKELAFKAEMACWWAFSDDADDDDAFDEDDDDEDQEDGEELLWDDDEDEETD